MIHVTNIIPTVGTPPDAWSKYSWFAVWDAQVPPPCDLHVGSEVILVRPDGLATWRTDVSEIAAFPFEHVNSALDELRRRWQIKPIYTGPTVSPGVLVAWRATPTDYVDLPVPDIANTPALACSACADDDLRNWLDDLPPRTNPAAQA